MTAPPRLFGIVPPIVTPLTRSGSLDHPGLARLIERLIEGGVHGIFALGTTGEGPSLPSTLRHEVVAAVGQLVAGRLPIFIGITDTIFADSVELAARAADSGATAVVLAPPYYLPLSQEELRGYTNRLVERLTIPLMLYNMPSCCKTWFEAETVQQLAAHPRIIGLKDSSGDMRYLADVVERMRVRPDFSFFVGPEELLTEAMGVGAHGGVNGGANIFPQLYVRLYEALQQGPQGKPTDEARALQAIVQMVSDSIYSHGDAPSRIIKGIKSALTASQVCEAHVYEPLTPHDPDMIATIALEVEAVRVRLGARGIVQR